MSRPSSKAAPTRSRPAASATAAAPTPIDTVEAVLAGVASRDPDLRAHALERAASLLRTRVTPPDLDRLAHAFEPLVRDPTPGVRVALCTALGHLRHARAEPLARQLANDSNSYVRRAAQAALAQRTTGQGRQLEERMEAALAQIESLSADPRNKELPQQVRRLGRAYFTYTLNGLTHETKAILNNLKRALAKGERELKGKRKSAPKAWVEYRQKAEREILTLVKVLEEARCFATPAPTETQPVTVQELAKEAVDDVHDEFEGRAGAPKVMTTVEVDGALQAQVPRAFVKRALVNVVRNAFEAIDRSGSVTITATSTPTEVTLHIADTGCGIAPEDQGIVFVGGRSSKKTTRGPQGNTGWGLTNTQAAVEDCGGRVAIKSAEGQGTTVSITLPRTRRESEGGDEA